ncbi:MAG: hypothetical protein L3K26_13535, partial [Candidatus Hydrogenedentes bacterium]|nr:hypothetical protein [Candidatus Hydrogenedentota bacterium]
MFISSSAGVLLDLNGFICHEGTKDTKKEKLKDGPCNRLPLFSSSCALRVLRALVVNKILVAVKGCSTSIR